MSRSLIVLLILAVFICYISANANSNECGPNERYRTCGTPCEPSCQNLHPDTCTMNCVIGCQCLEGYVRNSEGKCVMTRDC